MDQAAPPDMTLASRLALAAALATLAACSPHVEGNGVFAERTFSAADVLPFDRVVMDVPADEAGVPVKASVYARAVPREVVVSGDQNLVELISLRVEGGRLSAHLDAGSYTALHPLQFRIQAPELGGLEASAGAHVTAQGARSSAFAVSGTGGAHLILAGDGGDTLQVTLVGASLLDAASSPVTSAQVALAEGSEANVRAADPVGGTAEGPGTKLTVLGGTCGLTPTGGATCTTGP